MYDGVDGWEKLLVELSRHGHGVMGDELAPCSDDRSPTGPSDVASLACGASDGGELGSARAVTLSSLSLSLYF